MPYVTTASYVVEPRDGLCDFLRSRSKYLYTHRRGNCISVRLRRCKVYRGNWRIILDEDRVFVAFPELRFWGAPFGGSRTPLYRCWKKRHESGRICATVNFLDLPVGGKASEFLKPLNGFRGELRPSHKSQIWLDRLVDSAQPSLLLFKFSRQTSDVSQFGSFSVSSLVLTTDLCFGYPLRSRNVASSTLECFYTKTSSSPMTNFLVMPSPCKSQHACSTTSDLKTSPSLFLLVG